LFYDFLNLHLILLSGAKFLNLLPEDLVGDTCHF